MIPYTLSLKQKIVLNAVQSTQQHCIECDLNTDQVWVAVATDGAQIAVARKISEVRGWRLGVSMEFQDKGFGSHFRYIYLLQTSVKRHEIKER